MAEKTDGTRRERLPPLLSSPLPLPFRIEFFKGRQAQKGERERNFVCVSLFRLLSSCFSFFLEGQAVQGASGSS